MVIIMSYGRMSRKWSLSLEMLRSSWMLGEETKMMTINFDFVKHKRPALVIDDIH